MESALEVFGESLSSFETDRGRAWRIEILCQTRPKGAEVAAALKGLRAPKPKIALLADKDWVAVSERDLKPISVGQFFIHGSHFKGRPPLGRIVLRIDAGMAFGTGRHETTLLCLRALSRLHRPGRYRRCYRRLLDLGTGTGILAFAMARLFAHVVLAADSDPDAIRIARENARLNHCANLVRVISADSYSSRALLAAAPYDLVTANILAGPLIDLAPGLARVLAPAGRAVLSGLLRAQEAAVLDAHRLVGLELDFRLRLKGWSALVLKRARPK